MKHPASDKLALIGAMVIFGTIGLVRRYIPYPSSVIALARGAIGFCFLLGVRLARREQPDLAGLRRNFWLLCASGALLGANWICLFEAYRFTAVSVATVCYYMAPVFVLLAAPAVLKERLTLRRGLCALAAAGGMVLVSGVCETGFSGLRGVLFGLGAAAMYAGVVLLNKFIRGVSDSDRTLFQLGVSALALAPYVLLTQRGSALSVQPQVLVLLAAAGIVHTGIAYALYFGSIKTLSAQTVALYSYIDPVVAVVLSVLVLGETLDPLALTGVALVLGAMLLSELPERRREAGKETP